MIGGASMGLFDFLGFGKRKQQFLELQRIVMPDSPNRLIMSEKQLLSAAHEQAANDLRIVNDCTALLSKTMKPDVFFSRLDLLIIRSRHLTQFEPYISFSGASPTAAYNEVMDKRGICIQQFLERYHAAVREKAESMKTAKGRANQYTRFYDSLQEYYPKMGKEHIEYIDRCMQDK